MTLVSIQDYPVHNKYWYIVDFRNFLKPKLLPHFYTSDKAANRSIKLNFLGKRKARYKVMKGDAVKEYFLNYLMQEGTGHFRKYVYPNLCITAQQRKDHRSVMRRRLRRMGLLTLPKIKHSIKGKMQKVKPIINRQYHANRQTHKIKVLQIERKGFLFYYVVLSKELSEKRGRLFKLNTLRYNKRTGEMAQVYIHTYKTDFLTPYLIVTLQNLINEKIKEGIKTAEYFRGFERPGVRLVTY